MRRLISALYFKHIKYGAELQMLHAASISTKIDSGGKMLIRLTF